ncbi:amidohydrolase family protein [Halorarius halobius]|uniref:amidohydrolase family protein n=1 Tax=Halorarius halobius TaxID=2962671 RepID=UPI0020CDF2E0|nr:amidohydrolase family protein [Halorarius halobius]
MGNSNIPLEEMSTFDFGGHFHSESLIPDDIKRFNEYVGKRHTNMGACANWFNEAEIDGAALSQPYFMGHGDLEKTASANDLLLEEIAEYPQFVGLAAIPTASGGEEAGEEFERCLDNGYCGGAIATKSDGIELNDPEVEPILEVADQTSAPILVHPKLHQSLHPEVLDDKYRLNAIFGREAALSESIFKIIHDGVLDRYPNLNLVYHHLGGNIASMMGRINLQLDDGRWPEQEHVKNYREFKAQLEDQVYLDTSGFFGYSSPLRTALEEFPSTQLLFGTDAPYEPRSPEEGREFVTSIEQVTSDTDSQRILAGNATELLYS